MVIHVGRHAVQKIFQIVIWINFVGPGCFYQCIENSRCISAINGVAEQPDLPRDCEGTYMSFTSLCEYSDKLVYPNKLLIRSFFLNMLIKKLLQFQSCG